MAPPTTTFNDFPEVRLFLKTTPSFLHLPSHFSRAPGLFLLTRKRGEDGEMQKNEGGGVDGKSRSKNKTTNETKCSELKAEWSARK